MRLCRKSNEVWNQNSRAFRTLAKSLWRKVITYDYQFDEEYMEFLKNPDILLYYSIDVNLCAAQTYEKPGKQKIDPILIFQQFLEY